MPPRLPPRRINGPVNQIKPETWSALIDCIEYAMTHPAGDGVKILNVPNGLLSLAQLNKSASGGGSGGMTLAIITVGPNGAGPAVCKAVTIDATYHAVAGGADIPVKVPYLP